MRYQYPRERLLSSTRGARPLPILSPAISGAENRANAATAIAAAGGWWRRASQTSDESKLSYQRGYLESPRAAAQSLGDDTPELRTMTASAEQHRSRRAGL